MCGTTSPTNPISPPTETAAAVARVAAPMSRSFAGSTAMPRAAACSSPNCIVFMTRPPQHHDTCAEEHHRCDQTHLTARLPR